MKKVILMLGLAAPLSVLACHTVTHEPVTVNTTRPDSLPQCLAQKDAEKVLGQPVWLKESASDTKGGRTQYKCTYTALQPDPKTNATANLYYMLEKYTTTIAAINAYQNVIGLNKSMPGQTPLTGLGDAAFLHTDDNNFMMIVCRKGNNVLRVKINRLTAMVSKEELVKLVKEAGF